MRGDPRPPILQAIAIVNVTVIVVVCAVLLLVRAALAHDVVALDDPVHVVGHALRGVAFQETEPPPPPPTPAPVTVGSGADVARAALYSQGATHSEVAFAIPICQRESHCTLSAVNQNRQTADDSWGPWQINYFGHLYQSRAELLGPPATNTSSWERAARNFLMFLRAHGRCHWSPPRYCS